MSFISNLIEKYKAGKARKINFEQFREDAKGALSDGRLTADEINRLNILKNHYGLSDQDIASIRMEL